MFYWATKYASGPPTYSTTETDDPDIEAVPEGVQRDLMPRLPDRSIGETWDFTTSAIVQPLDNVRAATMAVIDQAREQRLVRWGRYANQSFADVDTEGDLLLQAMKLEEAHRYLTLTGAERTALINAGTEGQFENFPLIQADRVAKGTFLLAAEVDWVLYYWIGGKAQVIQIEDRYRNRKAAIMAATTAEAIIAAADLEHWPA